MSTVVHLPSDVRRFHAGLDAVRQRARQLGATPQRRRQALQTLLAEMRAGRSSGSAVALANGVLRDYPAAGREGGAA